VAETFGGEAARIIYSIERAGIFILFLLLWLPPVENFMSSTILRIISTMERIAIMLVR
jgi:hypothetical protein